MIVAVRNRLNTQLKVGWTTINQSNILLGTRGATDECVVSVVFRERTEEKRKRKKETAPHIRVWENNGE